MLDIFIRFLIYSILGTVLHFTYNFSKKSIIVGIFSAVNESVWEHIKLLLTPIFLVNTIRYVLKDQTNYFVMLATSLLTAIILILALNYLKNVFFKNKYNFINILYFYFVSFIVAYLGESKIYNCLPGLKVLNKIGAIISIAIFILYMTLTIFPFKNDLFKDPTDGSYGIK